MIRKDQVFVVDVVVIQHEKQWFQVSLVDQQVQLHNLTPLLKFASIEGFMKGTILFRWPWKCMAHPGVTWIVSLGSAHLFHDRQSEDHLSFFIFAFNFLSDVLVLLFNVLQLLLQNRKIVQVGDVCFRPPIVIRIHDLHASDIRGNMGEIASYHERDQLSPSLFRFLKVVHLLAFL